MMLCGQCNRHFVDGGTGTCPHCGAGLAPESGAHSHEPRMNTSTSVGDVGMMKNSHVGDQIGQQHIYYGGAPEEVIQCPRCYHYVKRHETFFCTQCSQTLCSVRCYDVEFNCCRECAKKRAAENVFGCACGIATGIDSTFECRRCGIRWCRQNCYDGQRGVCKKCAGEIDERSCRRNDICRITLSFDNGRKVFVVAKDRLAFGRAKRKENAAIDIVLRFLPLRSRREDPDNWYNSSKISRCHGFFTVRGSTVCVQDNDSTSGLFYCPGDMSAGVMFPEECASSDSCPPDTDPLLSILKPVGKGGEVALPAEATLSVGRSGIFLLKTKIFRTSNMPACLLIERGINYPQHAYIQLFSAALIGSSPRAAIRLPGSGENGDPAELSWEDVTLYLKRLQEATTVTVNGRELELQERVILTDNSRVTIGESAFTCAIATDDDFVKV